MTSHLRRRRQRTEMKDGEHAFRPFGLVGRICMRCGFVIPRDGDIAHHLVTYEGSTDCSGAWGVRGRALAIATGEQKGRGMTAPAGFRPIEWAPSGTYVDLWVPGRGVLPRCMLWIEQWYEIGPGGVAGERVSPEPTHWRDTLEDAVPLSAAPQ